MRGTIKVFVVGMMVGSAAWAQSMVPPGFAFLDRNHDGTLSPEELSRASGHLTPEVARFLDFDGDGVISPGEWVQGRQQVRSEMVKGALQIGTQRLLGFQPPPTYLLGRYLELRQRYEDTHRAASDPALQQGYDQSEERYARDAYDNQNQAERLDVQEGDDGSQHRYDDRPRSAGSAAQERYDAAQDGDGEQLDERRANSRYQTTQERYGNSNQAARRDVQESYDDQRQQPEHRAVQVRHGDSQHQYDDRPRSAGSAAQERYDAAQDGDGEQLDERRANQRQTAQDAVQERLGDLRERHENRRRVVQRAAQERLDEMRKGSGDQNGSQHDLARLRHHRPFQAQGWADDRQHTVPPFGHKQAKPGQKQAKPGHGGLLRHPGLQRNARQ